MKSRRKLKSGISPRMQRKQIMVYTVVGISLAILVAIGVFIYLNLGAEKDSEAAPPDFYSITKGNWEEAITWNGGITPPTTGINSNIEIFEFVTRNGDLSYASGSGSGKNLIVTDTLLIIGNLTMGNKSNVTVADGGVLIITGNFTADNKITVGNGGVIAVAGNMDFPTNTQDSYDGSGGGELFVNGSITGNTDASGAQQSMTDLQTKYEGVFEILEDNTFTTLPITLTYFKARSIDNNVVLSWQTAQEIHNDFFTIERSADGKQFHAIGTIKGVGNSNKVLDYEFIDRKPLTGQSFYQLKQTDFDGQFEYFDIVTVHHNSKIGLDQDLSIVNFGPNPFQYSFSVEFDIPESGEVTLKLTDMNGALVASRKEQAYAGMNKIDFQENHPIKNGTYLVTLIHPKYQSKPFKLIKN
ncbi:T9SS type A sorting domain-containing protein [Catalinimonas sp. 4WD22]|uniref:T9SS type A sorting domain-containing protein n=1 Tax=Catalinimonas locisalis TaxID=3133978 RepID=UPI0031017373